MIAEIQCLPSPAGTTDNPHAFVEAAIAKLAEAGLHCEVGALGTTVEGEPDAVWALLRSMHEATMTAGAQASIAVIKIAEQTPSTTQLTMAGLTKKFR